MHQILKFIFGIKLCMFRTVPLSIIKRFSLYSQQWHMSYRSADSLRAELQRPSWSCSQAASKSLWHTIAVFTVKNSWRWTEELSETCRVLFLNKFKKLVHLVIFIIGIYHDERSAERQIGIFYLQRWSLSGEKKKKKKKNIYIYIYIYIEPDGRVISDFCRVR